MMNLNALKVDPEFQGKIPPLTFEELTQLEANILRDGRIINPIIVWEGLIVDGHNRFIIAKKHPEIPFTVHEKEFASRYEAIIWICKNQLGRRNLTPEQKKFLIGKQYSVEHRKPGGNGNNQHTAAAKKTAPEELCQIDTIPLSGQFKVRDADMHRLARADFPNRKQIVHEILHPEDRPAPQSSYSHYSGINYSALEVAVRRIQQDFDFLMRYLPKLPDDSYAKTETLKILKQHKAYMAQFEEMLNDEKIA